MRQELPRGFRKRTLAIAKLAAKTGFKALRKTVRPDGRAREQDDEELTRKAEKLLGQMDELKGLMMKFGQMASYLEGAVPPAAQQVLGRLQAEATPMSFAVIDEVVTAELGAGAEASFDEFSREPFAAASIGQVHKARLDGRDVAVKIQYPGLEKVLLSDLKTLEVIMRMATIMGPMDGPALVNELRQRMREECDYLREADNQTLFAALLADDPRALVPEVVRERTARRVLTTELVDGQRFKDFVEEASQEDKNRAGETIFDFAFGNLFRYGVFNGDPHPGNYLFCADGRVAFLDFGSVKRFEPDLIAGWKRMASAILNQDREEFEAAYIALGWVPRPKQFDWDAEWALLQYCYRPMLRPRFSYTHEYVGESYDRMLWKNPNKMRVTVPADWLLVNRLQWGLNSILAMLNATSDWGERFRAAVESPWHELPAAAGDDDTQHDRSIEWAG